MKRMVMKKKKVNRFKIVIYTLIIYICFCYSFYYFIRDNKKINNGEFINLLLSGNDYNYLNKYRGINIINGTMKLFLNIDFTRPSTILNTTIFKNNNRNISLEYNDDYSDMEDLLDVSSYIIDPNKKIVNNPLVYIYNSHQLENYNSENLDIYGITPNVLMASYILKEKLNGIGIATIVEDSNMSEMLALNGWDYSYSYRASRLMILSKISEYSSLKYFIDIHRDSITRDISSIEIDGKVYARILFVVGQDYDTWEDNYNNIYKLNEIFNKKYPNLSRGILKKSGYGVDGVYNQDLSSNCILIELGGYENTIMEVFNTINAISLVLDEYIGDDING